MTKQQRRKQRDDRLYGILGFIGTAILLIGILYTLCIQENTYATPTNGNPMHYKYVTKYETKAIYIGKSTFLDTNGNEWTITNTDYKKGKQYILTMHDNATENNIKDDVIIDIK